MHTGIVGLEVGDWAIAEDVSEWIEVIAITVITISVIAAFVVGLQTVRSSSIRESVEAVKRVIGQGLLLGLDLLIAADVIRTVTLDPTIENVAALGLLVLVRTFLAWSLMVELHGRWPWQRETAPPPGTVGPE